MIKNKELREFVLIAHNWLAFYKVEDVRKII